MNKKGFKGTIVRDAKSPFKDCGENIYEQADAKGKPDIHSTNVATDKWYAGEADYDYKKGEPKNKKDANKVK